MTVKLKSLFILCVLWTYLLASAQQVPAQEQTTPLLAGIWQGVIEIPGTPLEVTVVLRQEAQGWQGTIDIPAQGAEGLPLENISLEGDAATFAIASLPGAPIFSGTLQGNEITGTFSQSGQEFPFTLARQDGAGVPVPGPAEQGEYADPQGRFSVPVPAQWSVAEDDEYVLIEGPEGGVRIYIAVSEGDDLEAAVAEAWLLANPAFDLEPDQTLEPPSEPGVERTIVVNYDPSDDEQVYQAVAQLHDGMAYIMLIDAELAALQRRSAQLQIIATGFELNALEQVDLTGLEPLPVAEVIGELEAFIEESRMAFGIPGAAIAIVQDGEVVYSEGFGMREAGSSEPITPSTQMMIGSTGKTLTSMLVATLVDDGVVDWDTPVVEILPEFAVADPELTQQITLRNLLCACTGVPRRDLELFFNTDQLSAEAVVESLQTFEFFTEFGEAFQYSNQLVATAGYAAAAADGASFGELYDGYVSSLQARVLDPIGMPNTTLSFEEVLARGDYAIPHQQSIASGGYEPIDVEVEKVLVPLAPAGTHWSTAEDMARYLITELSAGVTPDGERVVSEESLRVTWEPQVPLSATESYGLGWFVGEYKGLEVLHHGGNTLGFTSEFTFIPEADIGIVVLTNAQGSNAFNSAVKTRLFELLFEQPSETVAQTEFVITQTETAKAEAREQLQDRVDPQEVEPYLGTYTNESLGEITLEMDGEQLVMDVGEFRTEIRPKLNRAGEFDTYVTYGVPLTGLPIAFEMNEAGTPTVVVGQGAISYTFERAE